MRRLAAPALACCLVLAALAAVGVVPVAGHGNHLSADAQVVDDHVVAERAFLLADGYAVVHIDEGGSMGKAIGHVPLRSGPHSNVEIPVDQAFLSQIDGDARVWVTLHRSDGDGEFEPSQDTPLTGLQGQPAGSVIPIHVSDAGNVNVVARDFGDQRIDDGTVTIPRVETDDESHVVLTAADGDVVGSTALTAGVHENVSMSLSASFYDALARNESVELTATVHRDDGDGSFDPDADAAVTVADEPVSTAFTVTKVQNASRTTSLVVTAEETVTDAPETTDGATTTDEATGPTPGFEAVGAAVAGLAALLGLASRARARRRR